MEGLSNIDVKNCKKKNERSLASPIRIMNEFRELKEMTVDQEMFTDFKYTCRGSLIWSALIVPKNEPFHQKAWRVYFQIPRDFPESPPKVKMGTKIYHPNVNDKGEMKVDMIEKDNWSVDVHMSQVATAIVELINTPKADNPKIIMNDEAAKLFKGNMNEFKKKATEHANKNALERPPEPPPSRKAK